MVYIDPIVCIIGKCDIEYELGISKIYTLRIAEECIIQLQI